MKSKTRKKVSRGGATDKKASELKRKKRSTSSRPMSARQTQESSHKVQPETQRLKGRTPNHFPVVGIGASAGGLEAFTEMLKNLPVDTGMGFVLVQHLDPQHKSALADLLTRATSMPVREVTNNLRLEANHVYVIPPNTNLGIAQGVLKLQAREQSRTPTRSIDSFFESLAQDQRERAIGVILSGTATDGTLGLEAIKAEGGITVAQDDSARYDSMPRSAIAAGCVDFVLKPAAIAKELARIAKHPYVAGQRHESISPEDNRASATAYEGDETPLPAGGHGTPPTGAKASRVKAEAGDAKAGENGFKKILLLLRNHSGVDFSLYKSATIQRRITRRMVLNKQDTLEGYTTFLRGNAKELDALYSDVLISVTSFFRNPDAFDLLKRKVFPKILQQRGDETVRVWVLGCSTPGDPVSVCGRGNHRPCRKVQGRTPMMHGHGKSDSPIVLAKPPNEAEPEAKEVVEGRGLAKGKTPERNMSRTQGRIGMSAALERIRQAARRDKRQRFTALLHHVYDVEGLRAAYLGLKRAAAGIDGKTWRHYGEELERNLLDLSERLRRGAYRAQPVRRSYIAKAGEPQKLRPLGVLVLEDKIAQRAATEVLSTLYEQDFEDSPMGFDGEEVRIKRSMRW
jgi:CheB methylesterase/CheR methyltransferase, all-alpha domain/CheR methyltransferase, SAM binding domain